MKIFLYAMLAMLCTIANANLLPNPYNPETDKSKLLSDLGIPEQDVLLDRRCVVLRTEQWVKSTSPANGWTCVLVMTDTKLVLSVYDPKTDKHKQFISQNYGDIQSIALAEKEVSSSAEGKTFQLEVATQQGFLSIRAMRGKMGDRPFDSRGSRDAFDILKAKGIQITQSLGITEISTDTFTFFHTKK